MGTIPYNENVIICCLKNRPQTYNTFLGKDYKNLTQLYVLRKRCNILAKNGKILKTIIPGTRFGQCIFYLPDKDYSILIENGRLGNPVYFFYTHNKIATYYIEVPVCYMLHDNGWIEMLNKIFFTGNILEGV